MCAVLFVLSLSASVTFGIPTPSECPKYECLGPDGSCQKGDLVNCAVDPCFSNNGNCAEGEICTANYCNGCHAVCTPCSVKRGYCVDPNGQCVRIIHCFPPPCSINNGECPQGDLCTAPYCGGCNAVCSDCPEDDQFCTNVQGDCVADSIVNCSVDPCSNNNGGCGKLKCTANYCGGCNAICS